VEVWAEAEAHVVVVDLVLGLAHPAGHRDGDHPGQDRLELAPRGRDVLAAVGRHDASGPGDAVYVI